MPNGTNIPTPPRLTGDAEHKLEQLQTYLFQLSERLNMILNSTDGSQAAQQDRRTYGDSTR